ncbi:MAG: hypothetical protein Q4C66_11770 [Lachnospiraceae bacterium]|nr:hypothetical protein [Lachnospiraceae bacterium]
MKEQRRNESQKTAALLAAVIALSGISGSDAAAAGGNLMNSMAAHSNMASYGSMAAGNLLYAPQPTDVPSALTGQAGKEAEENAARSEEAVIRIRSVEEFLQFSRACVSERYSSGKRFVLDDDISLAGVEYVPAAVFAGSFDGGGHTISGLHIGQNGSSLGLFRYVEEGALITDLKVEGTLLPGGSRVNIGGIAGTNRGTIENCTFSGSAMAQESLGGIAGYNEKTGVIRGCTSQAVLTGNLKTGGIAGYNEGLVENCVNTGEINTSASGVEDAGDSQGAVEIDLAGAVKAEKVNDAGGISGLSLGTISGCTNYGAVGYPHTGYNMGGIAGRQSGIIYQCANYGKIQGRKDAGGIAGQFEPHLMVSYDEDTLSKMQDQLDALSDMGDSLSRLLENASDNTSNNLEQVGNRMDQVRDIGKYYKEVYQADGDALNEELDDACSDLEDVLDGMEMNLVSSDSKKRITQMRTLLQRQKELKTELADRYLGGVTDWKALREWLERRHQLLNELLENMQEMKANLEELLIDVPKDAIQGVEDFGEDLDALRDETGNLADTIRDNRDRIKADLDSMDDELTVELDGLSADVDTVSDDLKSSKEQIRAQKQQIEDQLKQIRNTLSDGMDDAKDQLNEDEEGLFQDISDENEEELADGMVRQCLNEGQISADFHAGGIAGIIGMEISLDPEQDLGSDEEKTLNVTRNARASIQGCLNRGDIQVKSDYAGGIAGRANLGALAMNQNYGDVAAEGDYAGGIAGSSSYVLRQNYSMSDVTGHSYVGGIAGFGNEIRNNYAMAVIRSEDGEWLGSIAGNLDEDGSAEGNFYVEEGIGAVDGVTYESQALGLAYEEFLALGQMPEEFKSLKVQFIVEDEIIKTITCQYGSALDESEIPTLPKKDGYYYEWEAKDLSCIKSNEKIYAVYKPWNTTIASSDDKMPRMLAEADFYPGTTLSLEELGGAADGMDAEKAGAGTGGAGNNGFQVPEHYRLGRRYRYSISQPEDVPLPEQITVRVMAEDISKHAVVACVTEGTAVIQESRWDGPYLVFQMSEPGEFAVLKPEAGWKKWAALGVVVLGILAACLVMRKKGRKKRKKGQGEASETDGESGSEAVTDDEKRSEAKTDGESGPEIVTDREKAGS